MFFFFVAAVVLLVSYFLGCINGSVMTSHFVIKDDVRKHGSGNAGLTNFYRTYGAKYALLVIACDMGKTVVAALIGGFMFDHLFGDWLLGILIAGIGCELGHIFPVFFGFKGGKGILSGGVLVLFMDWRIAMVAWGLFILLWLLSRYVSLGSISGAGSIPVTACLVFGFLWRYLIPCIILAALVIYCHRDNIRRLLRGTESKFKWHVNPICEEPLPSVNQQEKSEDTP
ncbi:MAG: glycerol-3-phosphate 1-O-acyltransferase PlsY [Ruminococcaceae bacterium]|jgi:glycerol-3-phosphate acyltransferase PlsY|nr:glycerol-3-phosphate 1-O-acyltransferase PlsY [Oscillospiraceae bacterium]